MDASLALWILIALVFVALAFDFLNGLHDAANSIATIVSTRVLRPHYAVAWAAFFNFIAFLFFGLHVADTVGRGIISAQVVDARSAPRFRGEEAEPRPGVRPGHMPGARNVHYSALQADGRLKDPESLRKVFAEAGVDPAKPVITTCGSGVTAAIVALALDTLGRPARALYDGSWSEWGGDPSRPVATGPA